METPKQYVELCLHITKETLEQCHRYQRDFTDVVLMYFLLTLECSGVSIVDFE